MANERLKGIKILGWIIVALAINELIAYTVACYFGSRLGYLPNFVATYIGIFSPFLYFGHLSQSILYELLEKSKAIFLDSLLQKSPFFYSVLFLISAIGILKFKNWARRLMIFCLFFLLALMCASFNLKEHSMTGIIFHLFKTLILLYPIIYLTRPKVREQFK